MIEDESRDGLVLDMRNKNMLFDAGKNNTVTPVFVTDTTDHNGRTSHAKYFDGVVGTRIQLSDTSNYNFGSKQTILCGFSPGVLDAEGSIKILASQYNTGLNLRSWYAGINGKKIRLAFSADGTNFVIYQSDSDSLSLNAWYYLSVTFDSGTVSAKLNDQNNAISIVSGTAVTSLYDTSVNLLIGCSSSTTVTSYGSMFNGSMDLLQLRNVALNAASITKCYNHWSSH